MRLLGAWLALALFRCASAGVASPSHSHSHTYGSEREQDGSYRRRDSDHYSDDEHHSEFDHEAILGSVKEAEEFDQLSPDESQRRLAAMLPKMDINGDKFIDREELKKWILQSFAKLSIEEAKEHMDESDTNKDGFVTWSEYLNDAFGVTSEDELGPTEIGDGMHIRQERAMFVAADSNKDGKLDAIEYELYSNPEEHPEMHPYLVRQTLLEKDRDQDGYLTFQEYVGEPGSEQNKEWLLSEKTKFDHELDTNQDGYLDEAEIKAWVVPDNDEIATEEVEHLFASADDDHDDLLSFAEITEHFDVFVGSEATDYGSDLLNNHFEDEL